MEDDIKVKENIEGEAAGIRAGLRDAHRVVIKVGTSTITYPNGRLHFRRITNLAKICCDLENSGKEVIVVSSGAIAVGLGRLGMSERPDDTGHKQALAAIGQSELMFTYEKFFSEYNRNVAQVLLTADVIDNEDTRRNVINTFNNLLELGVIPIVNENDTVATKELEGHSIGDNDTLSADVAKLVGADFLVIISDVEGLYDRDPREAEDARIIHEVDAITPEIEAIAGGAGTSNGTGGMITKIIAAKIASGAGIPCAIINGNDPNNLYRLFDGEAVGTIFGAGAVESPAR
ncbi:MAG: glutamate 5-kinase [Eubacteriales bacterium]|nr:glutamate 5-kinase [Eubacteriales bacterium]